MDFGSFLKDVGRNIGNFFGGNQRDDDEERRRQIARQQQRQSAPSNFSVPGQRGASVQLPGSLVTPQQQQRPQDNEPLKLGGVSQDNQITNKLVEQGKLPRQQAEKFQQPTRKFDLNLPGGPRDPRLDLTPKPVIRPQPKPAEDKDEPNGLQRFGAGFQQALGRAVDTAVQGGSGLRQFSIEANPFIDEEKRNKLRNQQLQADEILRGGINNWRDITGNQIVGNRDVDEAASRIAVGKGDAQDIAAVGARGLDVAGTTTMFLNPARTLSGQAVGQAGRVPTIAAIKQLAPFVAREAALYGTLEGTQATADTYGQTGDIIKAIEQFAPNFALGAAGQAGLEGAAFLGGRAVRGVAGRTPISRSVTRAADDAADFVEDAKRTPVVVDPEDLPKFEPAREITEKLVDRPSITPTTQPNLKPPAITSPNRPDPTVQAPSPVEIPPGVMPGQAPAPVAGVQMPEAIQAPVAPSARSAEQVAAEVKQALDEAAVKTPEMPPAIQAQVIEAPKQAEARAMAAQPTPINPEAVAADLARKSANDAPTEAMLADIPSYVPKDRVQEYLKSADYQQDQRFKAMAAETKSGDPFDHPDMYENPTPEIKANIKPDSATVATVATPTLRAFGREIPMTPKNGYEPVRTADGALIYNKVASAGSNRKGDRTIEDRWYDAKGNKLTRAQADAMVSGELRSAPAKPANSGLERASDAQAGDTIRFFDSERPYTVKERVRIGKKDNLLLVDDKGNELWTDTKSVYRSGGTGTPPAVEPTVVSAAKPKAKAPEPEAPKAEATAPAVDGELGKMSQKAIQSGRELSDSDWEQLAIEVGSKANEAAEKLGTDIPTIMGKVQRAYDNRKTVKTAKDAGLSEAEYDLYKKMTNEISYLRDRTDPSLLGQGNIDRWYAPRQAKDTEYTPDLVNEISRSADGLKLKDLDLTTTPIEQAIRRYGDAPRVITEDVVNQIENVKLTENGITRTADSGVKVSDEAKAAFETRSKQYVAKKDAVEKALAETDASPKDIDRMIAEADKEMDEAFADLMESIPKNTKEGREAITRLQERRGAYIQSTIRTNMFSNVVNRALDHIGSNVVRATNQIAGAADSVASLATGKRILASGRDAKKIAGDYSKGALRRNLMRDYRSSVATAGKGPLRKADAHFRAAGTLITGSSDLTTTSVKMTNRIMLARAQAEGITDKAGMEKYLREHINTPEYKELLTGVNDVYNGYLGLPTSITSRMGTNGRFFSNVDNAVNKGLEKFAPVIPARVRRELNDLIMPALSGFAGATYRIGKKALNSSMAGVPGIYKGMKLMKEGGEASREIGQMMIIRSMIDGLVGGVAGAATVAAMVNDQMEWTGAYPADDKNKAALWERQGIVPNSLRFKTGQKDENGNDVYVQIQPGRVLGPFAMPVVLPAVIKSGGSFGEVFDGTLGQMLENMGAEGVLRNAGNISAALTGSGYQREKAIENLMASAGFSVSNVVPVAGAVNNVANATDNVKRDTSGNRFTDSILNRNPVTRKNLPEKLDNLGDPVRNNTTVGSQAITTAVKPSAASTFGGQSRDNADAEMERLANAGYEDVMPGNDVKNTGGQDDAKLLLKTDMYKSASDETKAEMLKTTLLGTKLKDVNKNLSPEDRTAMIQYKLQNEDQRDAWLDDNNNAASYYTAKYNNLRENKTLSADDNSLQNKDSVRYDMVEAQVNKKVNASAELKELYGTYSQSDFKKMLDPESEYHDPKTAELLYKYDEIRAKAGVSGHKFTNRQKFSLDFKLSGGRGGRGGSRGAAGKGFTFASLPSSLVGTGSTGSGGSKYADNAPLFRPIADLKAPTSASIPRGRSISIKKGIHI